MKSLLSWLNLSDNSNVHINRWKRKSHGMTAPGRATGNGVRLLLWPATGQIDRKGDGEAPRLSPVHSPCMSALHVSPGSEISLIRNARRKGGGEM